MSEYVLRMPAGWKTLGDPTNNVDIPFDRGFTRNIKQDILVAKFGDGYEQRVGNGLNSKKEVYNVSFKNRKAADINDLAEFFDTYTGKNFTIRITNSNGTESITVVCETYSISYTQPEVHTLSATLRRVYEP